MARRALQLLILGWTTSGCHEVVVIPNPPLEDSQAVLLVVETAGEPAFSSADVPWTDPPSLILGGEGRVWALGYGCDRERLDLAGRNLTVDGFIPPLPAPRVALLFTPEEGWRPFEPREGPDFVRRLVPEDGVESCSTFVGQVAVLGEPATATAERSNPRDEGSLLVQAAPDAQGGLVVLQQVVREEPDRFTRVRGRYFRASPELRSFRVEADSGLPALTLASRGDGQLVLAGRRGLVYGSFEDVFSNPVPVPGLSDKVLARMAVSPSSEPLEAFIVAANLVPRTDDLQYTLSLLRVTLSGTTSRTQELRDENLARQEEALDIPGVVRTGPGEAWAIGFDEGGLITRVTNGAFTQERIAGARTPIRIAHDDAIGTVVTDRLGQSFLRPSSGPSQNVWLPLGQANGDRGAIDLALLDGRPTFAVFRSGTVDLNEKLRFVHIRASDGWCPTDSLDIIPRSELSAGGRGQFSAGFLAGAAITPREWWFVSGFEGGVELSRARLSGNLGVCGPR